MTNFTKAPTEIRDFGVTWEISPERIIESTWILPVGLTQIASSLIGKEATVRVAGGTLGLLYPVVNRVTTTGGGILEREVDLIVQDPTPIKAESKTSAELWMIGLLWRNRLRGDEVVDSAWVVPVGLIRDHETVSIQSTAAWIAGGTSGATYLLRNTVATKAGLVLVVDVEMKVS